ncbi:MAG: methyltransferase domain-containing protein [Chloroflexi bacterium]|nr:methyltransferase domain-containing protein [Chloroflexota bacterium]MBU1750001.1 methyltransferase domain-containing protein [Chloroflexota bacterium]
MKPSLLDILLCPSCGQERLNLQDAQVEVLDYGGVPTEEVRAGRVVCADCGTTLPIQDYVLSFLDVLPAGIHRDGEYWGDYFRWFVDQGCYGFLDLRCESWPFLPQKVVESMPFEGPERGGIHATLADHPLIRDSRRVLDIGCGTGWTSLYLGRRGFDVVAIDPSLGCVQMAKRHAIEQGVFVEYLATAPGYVRFRPESFDTVFAFHALHHAPDMPTRIREIRELLRPGGCIAIDEHVQSPRLPGEFRAALMRWVDAEVLPAYQGTLPADCELPPGASTHEDLGQGEILPAIHRAFHIRHIHFRYVFLDIFGDVYYLKSGRDAVAAQHARETVGILLNALQETCPQDVEYVTLIGQKEADLPAIPQPGLEDVYARYGSLFNPRPGIPREGASHWTALPRRALHIVWYDGLGDLFTEIRSYIRWRTQRMRAR